MSVRSCLDDFIGQSAAVFNVRITASLPALAGVPIRDDQGPRLMIHLAIISEAMLRHDQRSITVPSLQTSDEMSLHKLWAKGLN